MGKSRFDLGPDCGGSRHKRVSLYIRLYLPVGVNCSALKVVQDFR